MVDRVAELARAHGIGPGKESIDYTAEMLTRLSGDEVQTDATEDLLVKLRRRKVISGKQMVDLLADHYAELRRG